MEILLWLVPAVVATALAMAVVGWVGREKVSEEVTTAERLPGEVVGQPGEAVSAPRAARVAPEQGEAEGEVAPQSSPQRPPAPAVRRTA